MWESRLWVQRFAIITFRACRFVCINSVRQFPLCGVPSSQRRVRERESSLPLCPLLLALALRGAVRSGRTRSPVEAHHACNPPPALILVLERTSVRPDPFQEGPAIRESVNALTLLFLAPFSLLSIAFVNCRIASKIVSMGSVPWSVLCSVNCLIASTTLNAFVVAELKR